MFGSRRLTGFAKTNTHSCRTCDENLQRVRQKSDELQKWSGRRTQVGQGTGRGRNFSRDGQKFLEDEVPKELTIAMRRTFYFFLVGVALVR